MNTVKLSKKLYKKRSRQDFCNFVMSQQYSHRPSYAPSTAHSSSARYPRWSRILRPHKHKPGRTRHTHTSTVLVHLEWRAVEESDFHSRNTADVYPATATWCRVLKQNQAQFSGVQLPTKSRQSILVWIWSYVQLVCIYQWVLQS